MGAEAWVRLRGRMGSCELRFALSILGGAFSLVVPAVSSAQGPIGPPVGPAVGFPARVCGPAFSLASVGLNGGAAGPTPAGVGAPAGVGGDTTGIVVAPYAPGVTLPGAFQPAGVAGVAPLIPGVAGGAPPIPVGAPDWILTPFVEVGEAYNSNVTLAPRHQETWDYISTITPGANVTGCTSKVSLSLTYDPQLLIFARGTFSPKIQQRLLGTGTAEVVREMLFFDAKASIDQEFLHNTGPISNSTLTTSGNLTTVTAVSASPFLLQHLGEYANSETRYRFSSLSTSDNTVAPEQIHEALERVTSGEYFGRLFWTLTGDAVRIERLSGSSDPLGGTTSQDDFARLDLKYPVYQALYAVAGAGYERISDPTLVEEPRGPIWDAGLQYQPNQYLSALATYGRRFNHSDVEADATYYPSPDLHVRALYGMTIQSSLGQLATNLNQLTVGANGTVVNQQTGQPVVVLSNGTPGTASTAFGISSGSFLERRAELDFSTTRWRNTFSASLYDVKTSGSSANVISERVRGGSVGWVRQVWPDLSLIGGGAYYRATFLDGTGRHDNSYTLAVGLAYSLSPKAIVRLDVSRTDTRSNFAPDSIASDLIIATIGKQF